MLTLNTTNLSLFPNTNSQPLSKSLEWSLSRDPGRNLRNSVVQKQNKIENNNNKSQPWIKIDFIVCFFSNMKTTLKARWSTNNFNASRQHELHVNTRNDHKHYKLRTTDSVTTKLKPYIVIIYRPWWTHLIIRVDKTP